MSGIEHVKRTIKELDPERLTPVLKEFYFDIKEGTADFTDWNAYNEDESTRQSIALFVQKVQELKPSSIPVKEEVQTKPEKQSRKSRTKTVQTVTQNNITQTEEKPHSSRFVESVAEDVKFIKSFVSLHNKRKSNSALKNLLVKLQKSIVQKLINKNSPFAKEIEIVQEKLIKLIKASQKSDPIEIEIDSTLLNKLVLVAGGENVYGSIGYIKRYIGMQGKKIETTKASALVSQVEKAIKSGKVGQDDPYLDKLKSIIKSVDRYVLGKDAVISISKAELNGLEGILAGCGCGLNGLDDVEEVNLSSAEPAPQAPRVMSSEDFVKLNFSTIGFKGKWLNLIGDPSSGFTAMVFGKPKFGKSYLCVDFAGYLARNHGKVLYIAKEEELEPTFQTKIKERGAQHPDLHVSDSLIEDLTPYSFVIIDSVTRLGYAPEDLHKLEKRFPKTSFIYVFQVRKDGKFKGRNDYQHDVDIVIEVPEKGKAVQFGRFNQGGEIKIFEK